MDVESNPATIDSHPFQPERAWWQPCRICGLGAAAHTTSAVALGPDWAMAYRCPNCVQTGKDPCPHGR